ncbi:hypothetical protein F4778DRAFT_730482 [Xylariomycetidae sp. FL2044]|nr:hypothetical protein F4778DRAFT_730482 [Xylariomycetidae sp. FL2044]
MRRPHNIILISCLCGTAALAAWTCAHLQLQKDGHVLEYKGCTGDNNNSTTNPADGTLDLNTCLGVTPGPWGGGVLERADAGCFANSCSACQVLASDGYHFYDDRPFGSDNATLKCTCDSAEGLGQVRGRTNHLHADEFLTMTTATTGSGGSSGSGALACSVVAAVGRQGGNGNGTTTTTKPGVMTEMIGTRGDDDEYGYENEGQEYIKKREIGGSTTNDKPQEDKDIASICAARKTDDPWKAYAVSLRDGRCTNVTLDAALHSLTATCGSGDTGGKKKMMIMSTLDLNTCLANRRGDMKAARDGGFGASCNMCEIVTKDDDKKDVMRLLCQCGTGDLKAKPKPSLVDLNDVGILQVVGGQLACQGRLGVVEDMSKAG